MSLYTEPPTGNISWHKLESFAVKRMNFLLKVLAREGDTSRLHELVCEEATVADSDCLIAGSVKDKVSHFTLRLLIGGDPESQAFFCRSETALFDFHFSCMSEDEMMKFFLKIDKLLKAQNLQRKILVTTDTYKEKDAACVLRAFSNIKLSVGTWTDVVRLYLKQCSSMYISLPFQSVLHLVRKRQVTLQHGMAKVSVCRLREVVKEQFYSLMQLATQQASKQLPVAMADDRLGILWRKLKYIYRRHHPDFQRDGQVPGLSLEQVDTMIAHYPLCMSSLLRSLRLKHRLGHHARIQLTLFLKDLGLPVHQAVALWQQEYSLPSKAGSSCNHSWQSDGRRYTYSIRHLYGLEGARRNYRSYCCDTLQQRVVGCGEEGGCPFSLWDSTTLTAQLNGLGLHATQVTDILSSLVTGQASAACQRHLHYSSLTGQNQICAVGTKDVTASPACQDLQARQRITISPSPDDLHRADCCGTENSEISGDKVDNLSILTTGLGHSGVTLLKLLGDSTKKQFEDVSAQDSATESNKSESKYHVRRSCKRKLARRNKHSVLLCTEMCHSGSEGDVSASTIPPITCASVDHVLSPSDSKYHCFREDAAIETVPADVQTAESTSHRKSQELGMKGCETDNLSAPSFGQQSCSELNRHAGGHSAAAVAVAESPMSISKPLHFFQLSYQRLLQNLKSQ